MPPKKNLVGNKYGLLTVLSETNQRKQNSVLWECQCECGNICFVTTIDLTHGRVSSCGCLTHQPRAEDLLGQKFGKLVVIKKIDGEKDINRSQIWLCKCDCGNEIRVPAYRLKNGGTKSCGCLQKEKTKQTGFKRQLNIIGEQYGLLTVIKKMPTKDYKSMWLCRCSCNNELVVSGRDLRRQHIFSCGCLKKSYGEHVISKILEENNILYTRNYHFDNCKFLDTGYYAYFDFYIDEKYVVEYDGEQHFRPSCFNGINKVDAKENFKKTKEHDEYKNQYCFKNNIPIIRIPYTHLNEICLEDLLLETSKFILKERAA